MNLLKLLSAKAYKSGVELAQRLDVSRTTISNRVAYWRERGVGIDIIPGKGYRLSREIEFYDKDVLREKLSNVCRQHFTLEVCDVVGSTNDVVANHLVKSGDLAIVLAEFQESGRGRRGRNWRSLPGSGVMASIGWVIPEGFAALQGLSLAVGVVIIEALATLGFANLALKWPNDIVTPKGKVGGVLIELTGEIDGPCQVIVGIGLNWISPEVDVGCPADGLLQTGGGGVSASKQDVTVALLAAVMELMKSFPECGFENWRERWLQLDFYRNREVLLMGYQKPVSGIARGVDVSGALLIEHEFGIESFSGGEISMRPVS